MRATFPRVGGDSGSVKFDMLVPDEFDGLARDMFLLADDMDSKAYEKATSPRHTRNGA